MLRLRPYKSCDAETILSWLDNEETYRDWGGELFGLYPVAPELMNKKYFFHNGDCLEPDNFYPMTALDEQGLAGHFILRYQFGDPLQLRIGWVLVDDKRRGQGLGERMLSLGLQYAFAFLGAERVTIGVFETNERAWRCYKALGFRENPAADTVMTVAGEPRRVRELVLTREEYEAR